MHEHKPPEDAGRQLARALREKEPQAAQQLVDQYGPLLKAVAMRHAPPGEWEDALNEGLLAIWQNAGRFDPAKGSFANWAAAVVRYRALDLARRAARQQPGGGPEELENGRAASLPVWQVELEEMFAALAPAERQLLLRRYFYGYTARQIARAGGENLHTVNTRTARARQKLARLLHGSIEP